VAAAGAVSGSTLASTLTGSSPSTNPVCPNGTGGALTTSGCSTGLGNYPVLLTTSYSGADFGVRLNLCIAAAAAVRGRGGVWSAARPREQAEAAGVFSGPGAGRRWGDGRAGGGMAGHTRGRIKQVQSRAPGHSQRPPDAARQRPHASGRRVGRMWRIIRADGKPPHRPAS
jgi:hypothetical protein